MADDEDVEDEEAPAAAVTSELEATPKGTEQPLPPPKYEVRPGLGDKFQTQSVKDIITSTMQEQLIGRSYKADQAARWAKVIANAIRQKVQDLEMKRFKILVQTTIIEMKGAGVKSGQRCIWDPETDDYVDDSYRSETIFCYTIVYGVYMY